MPSAKRQRNSTHTHTCIPHSDNDAILQLEEMVRQLKRENEAVKKSYNSLQKDHSKLKMEYETVTKENIQLKKKVQDVTIELDEQKEQCQWYFDITEEQSTELNVIKKEKKKDKSYIKKLQEENAVLVEDNLSSKEEYRSLSHQYSMYQIQRFAEKDEDEELISEYRKQVDELMEVNNLLHESIDLSTEKYKKALEDLESVYRCERFMVEPMEEDKRKNKK
ncbi:hypothetical protein BDB01DRAFT_906411 [Pilobolus umbonatus]|nr:hypothetical protein BDB01DRAFT_906411 [Pilobolus umbonatus]